MSVWQAADEVCSCNGRGAVALQHPHRTEVSNGSKFTGRRTSLMHRSKLRLWLAGFLEGDHLPMLIVRGGFASCCSRHWPVGSFRERSLTIRFGVTKAAKYEIGKRQHANSGRFPTCQRRAATLRGAWRHRGPDRRASPSIVRRKGRAKRWRGQSIFDRWAGTRTERAQSRRLGRSRYGQRHDYRRLQHREKQVERSTN
jgi:hypothetical protein